MEVVDDEIRYVIAAFEEYYTHLDRSIIQSDLLSQFLAFRARQITCLVELTLHCKDLFDCNRGTMAFSFWAGYAKWRGPATGGNG